MGEYTCSGTFVKDEARKLQPFNAERLIKTSRLSALKIKIPSKNMREKPTNATIIHSFY
jgi:hypothetical protein